MDDEIRTSMAEETVQALWKVTKIILDTLDFDNVTQKICDSLLSELGYLNLGYRIIVLSLFNPECNCLQRVALSQTPEAAAAMAVSTIPFHDIHIPVTASENLCVRAFIEQKSFHTHDWKDILSPPLKPDDARTNQRAAGIKTSMIFPIVVKQKSVGSVIFSITKDESEVSEAERDLIRGFTDIVGISVQNAKLYRELDEANKKLKELDRLKDEFISIASHELRNPAGIVKNYVWTVIHGSDQLPAQAAADLERAYVANERLTELINDLLDVSRIESGRIKLHPEKFALNQLTREIITEKKVTVETVGLETDVWVMADQNKIRQVISNLIDNAVKFTPKEGKVTVTLAGNKMEVRDTGVGIAEADIPKLFTKFGRVDTSTTVVGRTNGTGLGLYVCKKLIELSGGQIEVESTLGKGTAFRFTIPAA